jgi:hypothetical protein
MDARQAARTLEVIRTLMERTCHYQLLTAKAALVAGSLAGAGALAFLFLDEKDPWSFGIVWGLVFAGSLLATFLGTVLRGRESGEEIWSRQARTVVTALTPSLFAALALTVFFFALSTPANPFFLWLPGVWMLCYGQGALATAAYAPSPIRWLGVAVLVLGSLTLLLTQLVGWDCAVPMMGLVFGLGHVGLGAALLIAERRESALRLHREVA